MVTNPKDIKQIEADLNDYCVMYGVTDWHLDDQHRINVTGSITVSRCRLGETCLPLAFGKVTGAFIARGIGLTSLAGSPHTVGHTFNVCRNELTSLKQGPKWVGDSLMVLSNPITSLEGVAEYIHYSLDLTYEHNLALLRLVNVHTPVWSSNNYPPSQLREIVHAHAGKGKDAVLNFALALKHAGFEGNARW